MAAARPYQPAPRIITEGEFNDDGDEDAPCEGELDVIGEREAAWEAMILGVDEALKPGIGEAIKLYLEKVRIYKGRDR